MEPQKYKYIYNDDIILLRFWTEPFNAFTLLVWQLACEKRASQILKVRFWQYTA